MTNEIETKIEEVEGKNELVEITTANLVAKLAEISDTNKYTLGYLRMLSEPSGFKKTNNPLHGRVKKMSGWGFGLNADYSRRVIINREKEGLTPDFEALPSYAEAINKIVSRKKTDPSILYLSVFPVNNFGQFTTWFVDNREATAEEVEQIKSFLPTKSETSRQGTEEIIQFRRVLLTNIFNISLQGVKYKIVDNAF